MTAPLVSLDPHDFEQERHPVMKALQGLMNVYGLPGFQNVYGASRSGGWRVVVIAVDSQHAEAWRAALGAPAFTPNPDQAGQMLTERFWFSTWVRVAYSAQGVDNV